MRDVVGVIPVGLFRDCLFPQGLSGEDGPGVLKRTRLGLRKPPIGPAVAVSLVRRHCTRPVTAPPALAVTAAERALTGLHRPECLNEAVVIHASCEPLGSEARGHDRPLPRYWHARQCLLCAQLRSGRFGARSGGCVEAGFFGCGMLQLLLRRSNSGAP